jgi:hypothetical protein
MKAVLNNVESLLDSLSLKDGLPKLDKKILETFFTQIVRHVNQEVNNTPPDMRRLGHQAEISARIEFTDEIMQYGQDLRQNFQRINHSSFLRDSNMAELILGHNPEIQEFITTAFGVNEVYSYTQNQNHQIHEMGVTFRVDLETLPVYLSTYRQNLHIQIAAEETAARLSKILSSIEDTIPSSLSKLLTSMNTMSMKIDTLAGVVDRVSARQVEPKTAPNNEKTPKNNRDTPIHQRNKSNDPETES